MKRVICIVLAALIFTIPALAAAPFKASNADEPLPESVRFLISLQLLSGDGQGSLGLERPINRAELAVLLYLALSGGQRSSELYASSAFKYTDLGTAPWALGYAGFVTSRGIMPQKVGTSFAPLAPVTLWEACFSLLSAIGYQPSLTSEMFREDALIGALEAGLLAGITDLGRINREITRLEATVMMENLILRGRLVAGYLEGEPYLSSITLGQKMFQISKLPCFVRANEYFAVTLNLYGKTLDKPAPAGLSCILDPKTGVETTIKFPVADEYVGGSAEIYYRSLNPNGKIDPGEDVYAVFEAESSQSSSAPLDSFSLTQEGKSYVMRLKDLKYSFTEAEILNLPVYNGYSKPATLAAYLAENQNDSKDTVSAFMRFCGLENGILSSQPVRIFSFFNKAIPDGLIFYPRSFDIITKMDETSLTLASLGVVPMLKFEKFYNIKVGDGIFVSNRAEGSLRITRAGYFEGSFGGIAPEGRIIADGNEYPLSVMYNPAISRLPENPGSHCLFYVEGQYIVDGVPIDETGVIPGLYCVIDQFYSSELGLDSDSVYVLLADGSTRFLPLSPSFELPLPSDQIAGKVFSYGFDGDRLILRSSTPPPGGKHLKLALKGNGGRFSATSMSVTLDGIPYYISQDSYIFAYVNNNSAFERRQWKVLSPSEIADGLTFGGAVDLIYREKNGRAEIVYINIGEVTL